MKHPLPKPVAPPATARRQFLLAAVIVLVTVAAYLPAIRSAFIWDDYVFITVNPLIEAPDGLRRFWLTTEPQDYFPLTSTTLWLEWRIWGKNAMGYHVVNVLLHAACALFIWRILRRLAVPGAWLAGLLFAVHPVTLASVAWITERKNTLSMFFYLLALMAWLRYDDAHRRRWYALALAAFLLALLAKTSVVVLPFVLLLLAWWRHGAIRWKDILGSVPFFALSLVLGLVTVWYQWNNAMTGAPRTDSVGSIIAAMGWIVWFYIGKLAAPVGLAAIYPLWHVNGANPLAYAPLALLVALLGLLWRYRKSWGRAPLFAVAYFLIGLLPVLGILKMSYSGLSLVADHFQYVAMVGVLALAAAGLARLAAGSSARRTVAWMVAVTWLAALATLTWDRGTLYQDEPQFWRDTLKKNPQSWFAWYNLGETLFRVGRYDEALRSYTQALSIRPDYGQAYANRGGTLLYLGQFEEALRDCDKAIESFPTYALAFNNRGVAKVRLGRPEEAVPDFDRALQLRPWYADAFYNRAKVYADLGRLPEALRDYDSALALKPDLALAYNNRAVIHYQLKQYAEAFSDIRAFEKLGGRPHPDFMRLVTRAVEAGARPPTP